MKAIEFVASLRADTRLDTGKSQPGFCDIYLPSTPGGPPARLFLAQGQPRIARSPNPMHTLVARTSIDQSAAVPKQHFHHSFLSFYLPLPHQSNPTFLNFHSIVIVARVRVSSTIRFTPPSIFLLPRPRVCPPWGKPRRDITLTVQPTFK